MKYRLPALLILVSIFMIGTATFSQEIHLVPRPVRMDVINDSFILSKKTKLLLVQPGLEQSTGYLNAYLQKQYGFQLQITRDRNETNVITLDMHKLIDTIPGAYELSSDHLSIVINAGNQEGIFYGIQTLIQLLPVTRDSTLKVPGIEIRDQPRFEWRGMHLDVARHMFSVNYIKRYLDFLALHKINRFHWHLTDDQGWRLEIKRYPLLTETGSCRNQTLKGRYGSDVYDGEKYCGFFTQAQVREIVQYAADRFIIVIPEIDMPGHTVAALTSYPFLGCSKGPYKVMETWGVAPDVLCAGNDSTFEFMKNVLNEVIGLFPSEYIHIGGDECPKERWKTCSVCQKRINALKLKDEHELQSYFIRRMEKYVNSQGRKIIGWDEILEGGLAPNAAVMSWRGEAGGIAAAKQSHYVVMTPENPFYINHSQTKSEDSVTQGGYNPLEAVYRYEPVPAELNEKEARFVLGAQGNLWSEYISNEKKLEYLLFPRLAAVSEVLWSAKKARDFSDFEKRLPGILRWYAFNDINFSNAFYDLQPTVLVSAAGKVHWQLESRDTSAKILIKTPAGENTAYNDPLMINQSGRYGAVLTDGNGQTGNWLWQDFSLNLATGKKIMLASPPNKSYSLGGASALVDGVQNEKGMLRSQQFLGFNGRNLEAIIDLGTDQQITSITLRAFEQKGSWIYRPAEVSFATSSDGKTFKHIIGAISITGEKNLLYKAATNLTCRYIRIIAKNKGIIPAGEPGAGHNAWVFADEVEVN